MLYIKRVRLTDIRCFATLDLKIDPKVTPAPWTVIVGDNATGKTALLRSIAIGLCHASKGAALLRESREGIIRRGKRKGRIVVDLVDWPATRTTYTIVTDISRASSNVTDHEQIRQIVMPASNVFPWDSLFVAAFGPYRTVHSESSRPKYTTDSAMQNLFDFTRGLQSPEVSLLPAGHISSVLKFLRGVTGTRIQFSKKDGLAVDGSWGKRMPFPDLAEGYRSSILWLSNLACLAQAHNPRLHSPTSISGIVLVDELECHLHARWQRTIMDDLRKQLPQVQFIVTTHSPLIASSVGQLGASKDSDSLVVLEQGEDGATSAFEHELMKGWRMDQVLASRAFRYEVYAADPEYRRLIHRMSVLFGKPTRSSEEKRELLELCRRVRNNLFRGNSPFERAMEERYRSRLEDEVRLYERQLRGVQ